MPSATETQNRPFLTELDERARVKGSRDPLGYMSIWGGFGRKVVGNLTNQTVSVRGFTTLLLGHWFAEKLQDRCGIEEAPTLDVFLRFEQLAGYCRLLVNRDTSEFRGIRRVTARLQHGSRVTLGTAPDNQILGNQRLYGLWGLYSVAARVSGLLREEPALTPVAAEFVERTCIRALSQHGNGVIDRIERILMAEEITIDLEGRDAAVANAVSAVLGTEFTPEEREFYRQRLVEGGDNDSTGGRQPRLAALLSRLPQETEYSMLELRAIVAAAERDDDMVLHEALERIRRVELILAPTSYLFGFVLTRDRRSIDLIRDEVAREWQTLEPTLKVRQVESLREALLEVTSDEAMTERILQMGNALADHAYGDLVPLVLDQNRAVMASRDGSAPWGEVEAGRLKVRLKDETGYLPPADDVPDLLRHGYFVPPLKIIQAELVGGS